MINFQVGDKAVYPTQGVAEVIGIEEKEISGRTHRFYSLRVLDSGMKILVPVDKADHVGLRGVIGEPEVREIYDVLAQTDIPRDKQTWNRRYRAFMDKLRTGSLLEAAEVYRDLSRLKNEKALSYGERKMLEQARGLVLKELAVARDLPEDELELEILRLIAV